ncbi:hypothetical protein AOC36_07015 [Erysipelothrix larvae]|uniref:DUF1508 domain-containing protein n=1 Tax=Erysipelothrix larvae TaxID=1514105 RepID=A0A0X8H0E1_9FIRM|nr:YegP family protein [Erysipelothrix larvae]AMC93742.1 hypothetical protein AOC36_07015 [Erysipelothrix larvae]
MGKYIIRNTNTGVKFDLKAVNGEAIATSEVYSSESACEHGIEVVRTIAPKAPVEDQTARKVTTHTNPKFEVYLDHAGAFRFRLKARNGEIIVASESYTTKASALNGIDSIRRNANSPVVKQTD